MLFRKKERSPSNTKEAPRGKSPSPERSSGPAGQTAAGGAEAAGGGQEGGVRQSQPASGPTASRSTSSRPRRGSRAGPRPAPRSLAAERHLLVTPSHSSSESALPSCLCHKHPGAPGRPSSRPQRLLPDSPDAHPRGRSGDLTQHPSVPRGGFCEETARDGTQFTLLLFIFL